MIFLSCVQVEELNRKLEEASSKKDPKGAPDHEWATKVTSLTLEDVEEAQPNGRHSPAEANGHEGKSCQQNGEDPPSPSPCTSPVLAKRPAGGYQSPYQAGINQRFHAARHKFQGSNTTEAEPQAAAAATTLPKEASPATPVGGAPPAEGSPVKQMARSTVTQVLSRFTTAMQTATTRAAQNNSPFGTDYRSLAAPSTPTTTPGGARATAARSPTVPRAERGHPPPIPPKKPGLAQAPASPATAPRSSSHLTGSCGLTSSQEGVKELDMVVSSN